MGLLLDYLDYFHDSDSMGYLIFCFHTVATNQGCTYSKIL